MVKQEWNHLFRNKMLLLVMLAVLVIPTIYTTLFLGSMWDPYGNVEHLPVAVVNADIPAAYNGKTLEIGNNMVDALKEDSSLAFDFVTEETAAQGLKDGTYYMSITIPSDFSQKATTLLEDHPEKMELLYETNPGTNYIASKMGETALLKIKSSISDKVTETYTETIFEQLASIGDGMQEAANGALTLEEGIVEAKSGNQTISKNLETLKSSTLTFTDGTNTLTQGLAAYISGVNTVSQGAKTLAEGTSQLHSGSVSAAAGASALQDGVKTLNSNSESLVTGAKNLQDGLKKLNDAAAPLGTSLSGLPDKLKTLETGVTTVGNGLKGLQEVYDKTLTLETVNSLTANNEATAKTLAETAAYYKSIGDPNGIGTQLEQVAGLLQLNSNALGAYTGMYPYITQLNAGMNGSEGIVAGVSSMNTQLSALASSMPTLTGSISSLHTGSQSLYSGVKTYTEGVGTLASGTETLSQGVASLESGAAALNDGAAALKKGLGELTSNNQTLLSGSQKLADGASQLSEGSGQLYDGSLQLADGMEQLEEGSHTLQSSIQDGADEVKDVTATDETISMFAAPIEESGSHTTLVENNGHAMAPYMMSVALWVGCIAFSLMYPLTQYHGTLKSGLAWWASKASVIYLIAIGMSLVMVSLLSFFNGFQPAEMAKTFAFASLTGITFMSMMYFFNILLGKVGSFLMLIFMVVQLAGSAGTYPVELSGSFVAKIHSWLPFTYTVNAFRSTISGGESIMGSVLVLGIFFVLFTLLTIITFQFRSKRIAENKGILLDFLEENGLA